jgi:hypothetical protein
MIAKFLAGNPMDNRTGKKAQFELSLDAIDQLLRHGKLSTALGERAERLVLALEEGIFFVCNPKLVLEFGKIS